jgi:hypothetical protein
MSMSRRDGSATCIYRGNTIDVTASNELETLIRALGADAVAVARGPEPLAVLQFTDKPADLRCEWVVDVLDMCAAAGFAVARKSSDLEGEISRRELAEKAERRRKASARERPAKPPPGPTAEEILGRMAKAYAECKTYRDSGVVRTVIRRDEGDLEEELQFDTAFVRPGRFRFVYSEQASGSAASYIVWRQDGDVRSWCRFARSAEPPKSLNLALAAATGVSQGVAHVIPALLLPKEIGGRKLTHLTEVWRIEDAEADDVPCFRVEGLYADSPMTIWIDKATHLVRRIDERSSDGDSTTTTRYMPAIDVDISEEELAFDPPEKR